VRFEVKRGDAAVPAFIVRYDGQLHTYLNRCAHMPMELDWKPGRFFDDEGLHLVCSTNSAVYAPDPVPKHSRNSKSKSATVAFT